MFHKRVIFILFLIFFIITKRVIFIDYSHEKIKKTESIAKAYNFIFVDICLKKSWKDTHKKLSPLRDSKK